MNKKIAILIILSTLFSQLLSSQTTADNLRKHIEVLTADSLLGRAAGTGGEIKAAGYISKVFNEYGITDLYPVTGQDFSFVARKGDTLRSRNIVAIIEGYDPALKNQFIVIGAHYDHKGYNDVEIDGKKERQIFRGADENASGVAALLEIAREINSRAFLFRRSVIIAAFGAGEKELTGSWYFVNRAFKYTDSIDLMINLDMIGRSGSGNPFQVYTTLTEASLSALLKDVSDKPAMISPAIYSSGYFSSDHLNFVSSGIPAVLMTTGLHKDRNTLRDLPESIDYRRIEDVVMYTVELARMAADMDRPLPRTAFAAEADKNNAAKEGTQEKIYTRYEVDHAPLFLNGDEQQFLDRWVYDYVKYPKSALESGIQGRVVVEFIIEKDGSVSSVKIVKSLDDAIDSEVVKVVKASPKWKAGIRDGEKVRVKIAVPVEFRLRK